MNRRFNISCLIASTILNGMYFSVLATAAEMSSRAEFGPYSVIELVSPNKKWIVTNSPPTLNDDNAQLLLRGSASNKAILLCKYFRSGTAAWSADSATVIFIDNHSVEDSRLRIFCIGQKGSRSVDGADRQLRKLVLSRVQVGEILYYTIRFIEFQTPSEAIVDVDLIYMRSPGNTGPASELDGRYRLNVRSLEASIVR